MGYSIPPGDYSSAPMQINVGAQLGKTFAQAFTAYGNIKRQDRAEAKRLKATQNQFKNQLILQQNELKTGYYDSLAKAGVSDDPEKENELYDQFKLEVDTRAKSALDARMKMQFDADLSDEERMRLGGVVNDFKSYSEKSLQQMGGLLSDADVVTSLDHVVVGDPMNGEQLGNILALQNLNGAQAASFDPKAITSRKLNTKGNQNIVTSTVKIPANSQYFDAANAAGEGGAKSIIQNGLLAGKIKEEKIGGELFYVFNTDINVSNYSSKGGMDLVQEKLQIQDSNTVLQDNNFLNKQGSFNQAFVNQNEVITTEVELDSNEVKTGYQKTVSFNIVNVGAMTEDKAYVAELDSEYESTFNNPNVSQAQKQQYLIDIGVVQNIRSLQKMTPAAQKKIILEAMGDNLWEGYFPEKYVSSGSGAQQIQMQLGKLDKDGNMVLTEQERLLLKKARDEDIKNPVTGKLYEEGESIYVIRSESSRVIPKTEEGGGEGTEDQQYFGSIATAIGSDDFADGQDSLFSAVTKTPGGKTYYQYKNQVGEGEGSDAAGIYEVDEDGVKVQNTTAVTPATLKAIYSSASKKK